MDDINTLSLKIDKLERDHKAYIEFGSGCFIGIFGIGIAIDHHYDPFLWLVLFVLFVSLVASFVIGVKKSLEKDQYVEKLKSLSTQG